MSGFGILRHLSSNTIRDHHINFKTLNEQYMISNWRLCFVRRNFLLVPGLQILVYGQVPPPPSEDKNNTIVAKNISVSLR